MHADSSLGAQLPCRTAAQDLWFSQVPATVEQAKALCVPCALRTSCLAGALRRAEPWGVWGGQLFEEGVVVPRKRPRGRPRKVQETAARAGEDRSATGRAWTCWRPASSTATPG